MTDRSAGLADRGALARAVWREHRALLAIVGAYTVGSALAWSALGWPVPRLTFIGYASTFVLPLFFAVLYLFEMRRRAERAGAVGWRAGWSTAWRDARRGAWRNERLVGAAIVLGLYPFLATTFTTWKQSIALLNPFTWDAPLIAADRLLLGGHDAWRLTHALLGAGWTTRLLDAMYLPSWALLQFIVWPLAAIAEPGAFRRRFLLSYVLTWIFGGVLAVVFASVGPCFLGVVAGTAADAAPFAPLMQKLARLNESFSLATSMGQQFLLDAARTSGRAGGGISAFPSLHVATATLLWLAGRHLSRAVRWGTALYAIVILVGSVHLGWHYLVDGLAGAALTAAIWWAMGLAVRDRATT